MNERTHITTKSRQQRHEPQRRAAQRCRAPASREHHPETSDCREEPEEPEYHRRVHRVLAQPVVPRDQPAHE